MTDKKILRDTKLISIIANIQNSIQGDKGLSSVMKPLVNGISAILKCSSCAVFLLDEDGANLLSSFGIKDTTGKSLFDPDMPLMKYLKETPEGIFTGDISNTPFADYISPIHQGNSVICVPVFSENDLRGFVYADTSVADYFSEEDYHFIKVLVREISLYMELYLLRHKIAKLSIRDELTGCFNRNKFDEDLEIEITCAERYERPVSLILMAIDSFGDYLEFHGVLKADELLKAIGNLLSANIRVCDELYQYSKEEFVVMLPGIDHDRAVFTAQRLQKIIYRESFEGETLSQPQQKITVSFGAASFPKDAVFRAALTKAAESALLEAQESGGDRVEGYRKKEES